MSKCKTPVPALLQDSVQIVFRSKNGRHAEIQSGCQRGVKLCIKFLT